MTPIRLAALAGATVVAAATPALAQKTILAHYMPWFETPETRGFWGNHWTGFNGEADPTQFVGPDNRRDIWANYYPLIEPYDSADPHALECQMLQMKLAGIDGVLADWYGLSSAADYAIIHFATEALFDATAEFGLQFAAVFEDRTYEFRVNNGLLAEADINADLTSTFQWMQTNWFSQPHYVKRNGAPLLLNFGPIYLDTPGPWGAALGGLNPRPDLFSLNSLWTTNGADGAFTWVRSSLFEDLPTSEVAQQRVLDYFNSVTSNATKMIPSANPGFNDVYAVSFPDIPYRDGDTFRDMLTVAMDGPWDHVQLVTWNDYGEGTMIEPTREFGYEYLETVQQARRDELGAAFTYTPEHLRLPAQLYTLRKAGQVDSATLDQISDLMKNGDPGAAAVAMAIVAGGSAFEAGPADAASNAGGVVILSAPTIDDGAGVSYQWEQDGGPLVDSGKVVGSNTDRLVLTGASASTVGVYRLRVAVAGVEAISSEAIVGVRQSSFGPVDTDNNGILTEDDLTDFIAVYSVFGG